jgi:hypothetical protein
MLRLLAPFTAILALSFDARADDTFADARADYAAGATAYDRKDYETAATRFARADERVPNPRALQLAMASALHGTDAALGMNLVERAESRAVDGSLAELARRLRRRFASEAARIRFVVPAGDRYRATVDGVEVDAARPRWVPPGKHSVSLRTEADVASEREVTLVAGATVDVTAPDPDGVATALSPSISPSTTPRSAEPARGVPLGEALAPTRSGGISPVFFWSGVAISGITAGAATALTVVAVNRHDQFVADPSATTAQTRAQIAWAAAGTFTVATVLLGLFTNFRGSDPSHGVTVTAGASAVAVSGRFR